MVVLLVEQTCSELTPEYFSAHRAASGSLFFDFPICGCIVLCHTRCSHGLVSLALVPRKIALKTLCMLPAQNQMVDRHN